MLVQDPPPERGATSCQVSRTQCAAPRASAEPAHLPSYIPAPRSYNVGPEGISVLRPSFNQTDGGAFSIIVSADQPA